MLQYMRSQRVRYNLAAEQHHYIKLHHKMILNFLEKRLRKIVGKEGDVPDDKTGQLHFINKNASYDLI